MIQSIFNQKCPNKIANSLIARKKLTSIENDFLSQCMFLTKDNDDRTEEHIGGNHGNALNVEAAEEVALIKKTIFILIFLTNFMPTNKIFPHHLNIHTTITMRKLSTLITRKGKSKNLLIVTNPHFYVNQLLVE